MPKVTRDEARETLRAAVEANGYEGEMFCTLLENEVAASRRRNRTDRKLRYVLYCHWAHAMKEQEVGPENAHYGWPHEVLDFVRKLAPIQEKGEIRKNAYPVTMAEFCTVVVGRKYGINKH